MKRSKKVQRPLPEVIETLINELILEVSPFNRCTAKTSENAQKILTIIQELSNENQQLKEENMHLKQTLNNDANINI